MRALRLPTSDHMDVIEIRHGLERRRIRPPQHLAWEEKKKIRKCGTTRKIQGAMRREYTIETAYDKEAQSKAQAQKRVICGLTCHHAYAL